MGAHFVTAEFPKSTDAELRKAYDAYLAGQRHAHGHDAYAGTLATCEGLAIDDRTFPDCREAEKWIEDTTDKWGPAKAVKVAKVPPYRDTADARARTRRIQEAEASVRNAEDRARAARDAVLDEAKARKSKTAKCRACGSAVALAHVRRLACPVCGDPAFLVTPTAKRRLDAGRARIAKAQERLDAERTAREDAEQAHRAANAKPGEFHWLVGGWAAS